MARPGSSWPTSSRRSRARAVDRIDRRACRQAFEERFCAPVMAREYLALYRALVERPVLA